MAFLLGHECVCVCVRALSQLVSFVVWAVLSLWVAACCARGFMSPIISRAGGWVFSVFLLRPLLLASVYLGPRRALSVLSLWWGGEALLPFGSAGLLAPGDQLRKILFFQPRLCLRQASRARISRVGIFQ